jgi:hypothetical protein
MYGNLCGYDNTKNPKLSSNQTQNFEDKKFLYWPDPLDESIQLCVEECPTQTEVTNISLYICYYGITPSFSEVASGNCWPPYQCKHGQ